jgi:hypothetical protein
MYLKVQQKAFETLQPTRFEHLTALRASSLFWVGRRGRRLFYRLYFMPRLVSERIKKLREEIAQISEANRTQMHRRDGGAAADHERRLQRLQEILDELMTLTDWKKT